jgi:aminoglycoside/choline kinase family phosphotransferase
LPISRIQALHQWLKQKFSEENIQLTALTGDAGFRCYYRFTLNGKSFIAVDAPAEKSNNAAFVFMQEKLSKQNVLVPNIVAVDLSLGFFCLADFGKTLLADILTTENMAETYQKTIEILPRLQTALPQSTTELPHYDKTFVELELNIFSEWLLAEHLSLTLTDNEKKQLEYCFSILSENMLSQPQVLVHRDYHSRNIMVLEDGELGIIDFQDAVIGPITYDIVSLLRDCYLKWPVENITLLLNSYINIISKQFSLTHITRKQWQRWFDLTGLQRHIKASGIFARLHHRDNKSGYLNDIPLTLSYIVEISEKYPELVFLHQLLLEKVLPAMKVIKERECK